MNEKEKRAEFIKAIIGIVVLILPIIYNYPLYLKISQISLGIYLLLTVIIKNKRLRFIIAFIAIIITAYCGVKSMLAV